METPTLVFVVPTEIFFGVPLKLEFATSGAKVISGSLVIVGLIGFGFVNSHPADGIGGHCDSLPSGS